MGKTILKTCKDHRSIQVFYFLKTSLQFIDPNPPENKGSSLFCDKKKYSFPALNYRDQTFNGHKGV